MAKGGNDEHRMLFDLRGKRRNVVKVVYGILALLMAASLLLVVGPVSIGNIFGAADSLQSAAEPYEERAERLERELAKQPQDAELLAALTRSRVNAGNQLSQQNPETGEIAVTADGRQQYELAADAWVDYLKATAEPSAGVAQTIVFPLVQLAETSRTGAEGVANIEAAAEAQQVLADQRPSLNSFFTLALYTLFSGEYAVAEKAKEEAEEFASSKIQREQVAQQFKETKKRAVEFQKQQQEAAKLEKEFESQAGGGEGPSNPLEGGVLGGGSSLAE